MTNNIQWMDDSINKPKPSQAKLKEFDNILKSLSEEELQFLVLVLTISLLYKTPLYLLTGPSSPLSYFEYSVPEAIKNFFYGIEWHNQSHKKPTERAIKLVIERLLK